MPVSIKTLILKYFSSFILAIPIAYAVNKSISHCLFWSQNDLFGHRDFSVFSYFTNALFSSSSLTLLFSTSLYFACVKFTEHTHTLIPKALLSALAWFCLATGTVIAYGFIMELFIAWYGGNSYESIEHALGTSYTWLFLLALGLTIVPPQLFWLKRFRSNHLSLWITSLLITIGLWHEEWIVFLHQLSII